MKILLIEDDQNTADMVKVGLTAEGYTVDIASDGSEGSFLARSFGFEVIILDYSLPKKNGIEVCKEIRNAGVKTPVIFLSVEDDSETKIRALDCGADDYITKPFSFRELFARLRAIIRRPTNIAESKLCIDDLMIDLNKKIVLLRNIPVQMTRKEYDLLEFMMRNKGHILSRALLMEHVWSADSNPFSNTVEAHIRNLRRKINVKGRGDLITNLPGRGYMIQSVKRK